LDLDTPDDKGISKRQRLNKVYEQSGELPKELEGEVKPEFWDESIFSIFFDIFQKGEEFYRTLYYYQKIYHIELDGEDTSILFTLWNHANKYLSDRENKTREKLDRKNNNSNKRTPNRRR
jgi:hypothetical protein